MDKIVTMGSGGEFTARPPGQSPPLSANQGSRWMAGGYVDPYKGTHRLVEALAVLPPADRPVIDWYGQTEHNPAYFSWCQALARSLGVQENIRFHGWVDHEQMGRAWQSHDIFISTATHEGYGLVFCEALAQGVFLLGPRGSSVEEFVAGAENGLCYETASPAGLAGAVLRAGAAASRTSREERRLAASGLLSRHLALPSLARALRSALNW